MKKIGGYFKLAYISVSAKWLFGALAALSILPDLIKTILSLLFCFNSINLSLNFIVYFSSRL